MAGREGWLILTLSGLMMLGSFTPASSQKVDLSDSLWAIVVSHAEPPDLIDMGRVHIGHTKDSVVRAYVRNPGPYPIRIDSITIDPSTDPESNFGVASGTPFTLAKDESQDVNFWFTPKSPGMKRSSVRITTQSGVLDGQIIGMAVQPSVSPSSHLIDFGRVQVQHHRDSLVTAAVCNTSAASIRISGIAVLGPDTTQFHILSSTAGFALTPGECRDILLRFQPLRFGGTSARVVFHHDDEASPIIIDVFGVGVGIAGSSILSVDTISAGVGAIVDIPVRLRASAPAAMTGVTGYYSELRLNATLLFPCNGTPSGSITDGMRTIVLDTLPAQADTAGVLVTLHFIATLGDSENTPLILQHSYARRGMVSVTEEPGFFQLLDICRQGGTRLISLTNRLHLYQNRPNPCSGRTTIDYEVIEHGMVRIIVTDVFGRELATVVDAHVEPGRYTTPFDASGLPSGTYMVLLRTPSSTVSRLMEVLK